jgi:hypothetical protein
MLVAARLRHISWTKWGKRRYLVMETLLNAANQEGSGVNRTFLPALRPVSHTALG